MTTHSEHSETATTRGQNGEHICATRRRPPPGRGITPDDFSEREREYEAAKQRLAARNAANGVAARRKEDPNGSPYAASAAPTPLASESFELPASEEALSEEFILPEEDGEK